MNRLQFKVVRELFHELSEKPAGLRSRILAERELDPDVRAEIESLLEPSEGVGGFEDDQHGALGSMLLARKLDEPTEEEPLPEQIGPYRILRKVGEGGMGLVYAARREGAEDLVAVKVIRPSIDSGSFLKRFAREVRVLRKLIHVGIAAFFDEGLATVETATGTATLPYLAMELIDGLPIGLYADQHELNDHQRVELVALVADALQHAHEQGIVHRDLKPSNILVVGAPSTGRVGQPKVLDFGIAQATNVDADTLTVTTKGMLMGTLPYMSPEQVSADHGDLDARSDVYALGVILYELLAGRLPYPIRNTPIPRATRMIMEEEPTRLGSVARRLRGDLEIIVAKALEKERRHRYSSAAALAADLRRYLTGEPIVARPPTWPTRVTKFARRNKALTAVTMMVFAGLSVGLVVALLFAVAESKRATESAAEAYRSSMSAAALAYTSKDLVTMRRQLQGAQPDLRGWEWGVMDGSQDESIAVRRLDFDPTGVVLAYSNSGTELICRNRTPNRSLTQIRFLDAQSGDTLSVKDFEAQEAIPTISPNGEWVAWQAKDKSVRRARTKDGSQEVRVEGVFDAGHLYVSNTGTVAIGALRDGFRYIDVNDDGTSTVAMLPPTASLRSFSSDGRQVAYVAEGKLCIWDAARGERKSLEPAASGWTAQGPDSQWIAVVRKIDNNIDIWRDDRDGPPTWALRLRGNTRKIRCVAFSPDGQLLASGGDDQAIRIWRLQTGEPLATRVGHSGRVGALAFSPDGSRLASIGMDSTLRFWNTAMDPRVLQHSNYVYGARFSPDGTRIYTGSWDSFLRAFDTESGAEIAKWPIGNRVRSLAVGPRGRWVAAAGDDVVVLDAVHGREIARFEEGQAPVGNIAASPVENVVAVLSRRGELLIYDPLTGDRIKSRALPSGWSNRDVEFSLDGQRIAVAGGSHGAYLLDARSLATLREFPIDSAQALAFSPDGNELAIGTTESTIHVIRLDDPDQEARILEGHTAAIYALAYTPDGQRLLSGSDDHTLGVWDSARGQLIARLSGHSNYVYDLDVSPDGRRVVTGSGDGTALIWEPYPLAKRFSSRDARRERVQRWRPVIRERIERDGLEATAEGLLGEDTLDSRERQTALQVLLALSLGG